MKESERPGVNNARRDLDRLADELADILGIDPAYVMTEPAKLRISISMSQAQRIVERLKAVGI